MTAQRIFSALASRLPVFPGSVFVAAGFNVAFGAEGLGGLEPLYGKVITLRLTDAGISPRFTVTPSGFVACAGGDAPAVTISAGIRDFVQLALRRVDPDTLFFDRRLVIEGDTELGLLLKNRLDALDLRSLAKSPPRPRAVLAALGTALLARTLR
jgi:O2-independent ubiquinone biosynthesis accessory factor UbiT